MKTCSKCKIEKELSDFYKKKASKDGFRSECKKCILNKGKIYYQDNKDERLDYYYNNREEILEKKKVYYQDNIEKISEKDKKRYSENKEKENERTKMYYSENKDIISERKRKKYNENPDKERKRISLYRKKNKDRINEKIRLRKQDDTLYKAKMAIRSVISCSIRNQGYKKNSLTYEILCCSYEDFKSYIEEQFTEGMSWENYGEWHLDHKTPISWADSEEKVYELNHYLNFQPLWAFDNLSKGNKWSD
jgi:hypothetical protein